MPPQVDLISILDNYDREERLISEIVCFECQAPIDYSIMENANPTAAGKISIRSAMGGIIDDNDYNI